MSDQRDGQPTTIFVEAELSTIDGLPSITVTVAPGDEQYPQLDLPPLTGDALVALLKGGADALALVACFGTTHARASRTIGYDCAYWGATCTAGVLMFLRIDPETGDADSCVVCISADDEASKRRVLDTCAPTPTIVLGSREYTISPPGAPGQRDLLARLYRA